MTHLQPGVDIDIVLCSLLHDAVFADRDRRVLTTLLP